MKTDKKSCYLKNSKRDAMKNKEKNQAQSSQYSNSLSIETHDG